MNLYAPKIISELPIFDKEEFREDKIKIIRVEVRQEDIANGQQRHCLQCPIALALRRYLREDLDFSIGISSVVFFYIRKEKYFSDESYSSFYSSFQYSARDFIEQFDEDGSNPYHMTPFSFFFFLCRNAFLNLVFKLIPTKVQNYLKYEHKL